MNVRQFGHFLAVLENGSILKASRQLNISQPALSKSIAALENVYGLPLFRRQSRGVQPTAFALALERHARRILDDVDQAHDALAALAAGSSGRIAAGAGSSFIAVVGQTIREISALLPGVDFTVVTDHADHLRNALLANRIDFFVGMYNRLIGEDAFAIEHVFSDRFVGICRADHPLAGRDVPIEELLQYAWIVPELEEAGRVALEAFFVSRQLKKPRFEIATNSDTIVSQFLRETDLLSVLPEASTRHGGGFAGLAKFTPIGFRFERRVGIVRRANVVSTPLLDKFVAALAGKLLAMGAEVGVERLPDQSS